MVLNSFILGLDKTDTKGLVFKYDDNVDTDVIIAAEGLVHYMNQK